jgi:hypothetical protein
VSSGQAFNLETCSLDTRFAPQSANYPLSLVVNSVRRSRNQGSVKTVGLGVLDTKEGASSESKHINFECNVSLYSVGNNVYRARADGPHQFEVLAREVNSDELREFVCMY